MEKHFLSNFTVKWPESVMAKQTLKCLGRNFKINGSIVIFLLRMSPWFCMAEFFTTVERKTMPVDNLVNS